MLAKFRNLSLGITNTLKPLRLSTMSGSPTQQSSPRAMKRQKLDHEHEPQEAAKTSHEVIQEGEESEAEAVAREMGLPIEFEKTYEHELDYRKKLVLAPMVRTGSCE